MNVLEQLTLAWQCLMHTLRQLARPALWAPWLALGAVQAAVLAALWWFAHPWVSWLVAPLVRAAAGEEALRYPNLFRILPALFSRADLVTGAVLGALAIGASTVLFAARFAGGHARPGEAFRHALRRAPALILANLPLHLVALALFLGLEAWLGERQGGGMVRRLSRLAAPAGLVVFQAWFLYVNALVMLEGRGWLAALAALPRAAARGLAAALFLSAVTLLPLIPIQYLARASSALVERGIPELVGWLVAGQIGIALVSGFLLTGGATLVFQSAIARRGEEGGA